MAGFLVSVKDLADLAGEIREYITHSVSRTGGHLASSLGVVELAIALHHVFDFKKDRLLWDVGHQCYAHKILTGRKDQFAALRKREGISGFPSPAESEYDPFHVGHAGTSIATAIGMALGAQYNQTDEKIVAIVGDASIVNGPSFEALNNLGLVKRQLLIILNDNSMAIDVTQGSIAKFLSKVRLSHTYEDLRRTTKNILEHLPVIGKRADVALEKFKKTLRMAITPSRLFESLNIPYFGPVDGHDIGSLIQLFGAMNHLDRPAILHVYTKKGKGFTPAGDDPRKFHSTGPFVERNGKVATFPKNGRTFTEAFEDSPVAIRYPRDIVPDGQGGLTGCQSPFELGKSVTVRRGSSDVVIVALGSILAEAVKAADILAAESIDISVVNARFAKPIDEEIVSLFYDKKNIITVEDHSLACGFGSALLEAVAKKSLDHKRDIYSANIGTIVTLGGPDRFIQVGSRRIQLDEMGVSAGRIVETARGIEVQNKAVNGFPLSRE